MERYLFGAILANYRLSERKIEKSLKKKAPLTAFLERYLFGEIGNKFHCWEGIIGKMEKNQKNSAAIFRVFGKILVWSIQSILQAYGKKNQKKSEKIRRFPNFSGRYLVKAKVYQRWQRQFFAKKFKKIPPMGRFLERYLFRRRPGFLLDRKKIEKSSKFFGHFGFFLEDTYTRAEKGINNISHAGKEKNGKNEKKSDHFRIFVEDTWLERSDGNFNNNAQ